MQALNSLATPEEKLAALCKKYADLVRRVSVGGPKQVTDEVLFSFDGPVSKTATHVPGSDQHR